MIDDSQPWKTRLTRDAKSMRVRFGKYVARKRRERGPSDSLFVYIESFVFTAAFIIRKLKDSKKLSDELESKAIRLGVYRRRKRRKHDIHGKLHPINKEYTFRRPSQRDVSLKVLCDLIIHSHDFLIIGEVDGIQLTFNSDRTRNELYQMSLESFMSLVEEVADDDIVYMHWSKKSLSADLTIVKKSRTEPRSSSSG